MTFPTIAITAPQGVPIDMKEGKCTKRINSSSKVTTCHCVCYDPRNVATLYLQICKTCAQRGGVISMNITPKVFALDQYELLYAKSRSPS